MSLRWSPRLLVLHGHTKKKGFRPLFLFVREILFSARAYVKDQKRELYTIKYPVSD
jgi:hypothetical protein